MELTLGRIAFSFRILPTSERAPRREGPAGEGGLARLLRTRRDEAHVAGLDPHLRRDIGLDPRPVESRFHLRHVEIALWAGLHG
ncbi:MAG: hypothetical protein K2X11_11865 [Acetobacteraceae bacterium]|nr:hypothetical protein [Acetobacteraceae bacterium]